MQHGWPGQNVPVDMHIEHLNKVAKGSISFLGSNMSSHESASQLRRCLFWRQHQAHTRGCSEGHRGSCERASQGGQS